MTDRERADQIALIQEAVRPLMLELIRAVRTPFLPTPPTPPKPPAGIILSTYCGKKLTGYTGGCSCSRSQSIRIEKG